MLAIEHFDRGVERFPDRVHVEGANTRITYREMQKIARATARALIEAGIAPDDPVAILSPNHPMVLACQYGTILAGGLWTPANYRNTAPDTARQLVTYGANPRDGRSRGALDRDHRQGARLLRRRGSEVHRGAAGGGRSGSPARSISSSRPISSPPTR